MDITCYTVCDGKRADFAMLWRRERKCVSSVQNSCLAISEAFSFSCPHRPVRCYELLRKLCHQQRSFSYYMACVISHGANCMLSQDSFIGHQGRCREGIHGASIPPSHLRIICSCIIRPKFHPQFLGAFRKIFEKRLLASSYLSVRLSIRTK